MKAISPKNQTVIASITNFLSNDLLHEEIQQMPADIQEIFDLLLDTDYGNNLNTRRKMLRFKELTTGFAKALAPFSEQEIQDSCKNH
jgi:hypothetical protein